MMITSALLVAAVVLSSVTSSFGAPIPAKRGEEVPTLGRRFPKPYSADDLVARAVPVADAPSIERRFPRRIYYERYAKRDEANVNVNEVVARSAEPSLLEREHAQELEKRTQRREMRKRDAGKDLFKRTLQKEGVQKRHVDPIAKRAAAPGENPSIKSRAFIPPKNVEQRDLNKITININTGEIDVTAQEQDIADIDIPYGSVSSSAPTTQATPSQTGPSGSQVPPTQANPSPSIPGQQTPGQQTPPSGTQPGPQDPNASGSPVVPPSASGSPNPSGIPTGQQQPPTGQQQPPTGQQQPPTQPPTGQQQPPTGWQQPPTGQQPPAGQQPPTGQQQPPVDPSQQQPPAGSIPIGTGSTSTSTSTSTDTTTPTSTPVTGGSGNQPGPSSSSTSPSQTSTSRSKPSNRFKRVVPALTKRSKVGSPIQFKRDV